MNGKILYLSVLAWSFIVATSMGQSVEPNEDAFTASSVAIVYTSDDNLDEKHNLYAVSADGRHLNLSHSMGEDHHVSEFALSPDEHQVAFLADSILYVVPTNNDVPVPVSLPAEDVLEFAWAPDGNSIAYRAQTSSVQVFIVDPNGANHVNLSGTEGEVLTRLRWSPDGTWISYISDKSGVGSVYLVRPDGSEEVKISDSAAPPGTFRFPHYAWSPSSNDIAFRADAEVESLSELWVSQNGAPAVWVSIESGTTGSIGPDSWWAWSPDGIHLAYRRTDAATNETSLFVTSKGGGDAHKVSDDLHAVSSFQWCGNAHLTYLDEGTLYVTDLDGNVIELASEPVIRGIECTSDGSLMGFLASDSRLGPFALFVTDLAVDPPAIEQVSEPDAEVTTFAWGLEPIHSEQSIEEQSNPANASAKSKYKAMSYAQSNLESPERTGQGWNLWYDETSDGRYFIHHTLPGGQAERIARLSNTKRLDNISAMPNDRVYLSYRHFHDGVFFDETRVFGNNFSLPPIHLGPSAELQPFSKTEIKLLQNIRGSKSLRDTLWTRFDTSGPSFPNLMFHSAATGGLRHQIQLHVTAGNQISNENPPVLVDRIADPLAPLECIVIDLFEQDYPGVFHIDFFGLLGTYLPNPDVPSEGFDIKPDTTNLPSVIVNTGFLNVRSGPSAASPFVETLADGTELTVHAGTPDGKWFLVNGNCGRVWVQGDFLLTRGDFSLLPVADAEFFLSQ